MELVEELEGHFHSVGVHCLLDVDLFVVMLPRCEGVINTGNPDAKRLYDDLLSNYNKLVRPVQNTTDPLTVRIKLKLSQLIDVVSVNVRLPLLFWSITQPLGGCGV